MIKNYKKVYEDVYSTDRKNSKTKLYIEKVSVVSGSVDEYIKVFNTFLGGFYANMFDGFLKIAWLRRQFCYYNKKTLYPISKNSLVFNLAFVKFIRRYVQKDIQIITRNKFFSRLETYFEEMYPGFYEGNPFENPEYYKFPFKTVSVDYMMAVFQMDERLELLKYAEENKMSYPIFIDYVINYVMCLNEEQIFDKYVIINNDRNFPFYVRKIEYKKKKK